VNAAPLLFLLVVAAAFWLLMVRPQQRRARVQQDLQAALSVGDEVMTTSGIFGEVRALEGETVHLAVADGVQIRVVRAAIARVVPPETDTHDEQTEPVVETAEPEEKQ